jgi:hypothetical protein
MMIADTGILFHYLAGKGETDAASEIGRFLEGLGNPLAWQTV